MWDLHMGYAAVWKILEEIIIELRKKGVETPAAVMNDLKSAKVLMNVLDVTERDRGEAAPKIEQYLGSVEAYLVTEAQKTFPPARIDTWLRRIEEANCDTCKTSSVSTEKVEKAEAKFITGVPRDQKWIRVKPLPNLPTERLKQLAEETSLSFREENEHLIVHGTAENIKKFIKKMTQQTAKE
jgi:hypothetical protein